MTAAEGRALATRAGGRVQVQVLLLQGSLKGNLRPNPPRPVGHRVGARVPGNVVQDTGPIVHPVYREHTHEEPKARMLTCTPSIVSTRTVNRR